MLTRACAIISEDRKAARAADEFLKGHTATGHTKLLL